MNILVIGDNCIDEFVYGDIHRVSPEAPVPVIVKSHEHSNDGMAMNVYNNIKSLGANAYILTNGNSIIKRRFVDNRSGQMVLRVDENDRCDRISEVNLSKIYHNKFDGAIDIDAIAISDYCKGFLHKDDIKYICDNNENVFVDTKKQLGDWIKNADFIKINELEYKKNYETFSENGFRDKLIVTLGGKGCRYMGKIYPVHEVPVKDVSGAGDTFLAALAFGYLNTGNIVAAIEFAQQCTTVVVQRQGVTTVTLEDLNG